MDLTLNPQHLDRLADFLWVWAAEFLPRLVAAVIVLALGILVARWVSRGIEDLSRRTGHVDPTLRPVLAQIVRYAILILVLIVALTQLGVQTASLLAVVGAAGLAIGLALQGTLSNLAAGLMLLWLRPFRVGDFVEGDGIAGTVREIGLFASHLETFDGLFLFAPNSLIWNKPLKNHSREAWRLVAVAVTVGGDADIGEARAILLRLAERDPRILNEPSPRVFVEGLTAAGLLLTLRLHVPPGQVGDVQRTIVEAALHELAAAGIDALKPHQVQRIVPPDSDPSRLIAGAS